MIEKDRIIAIDYGHKRTGIAVTDLLQIIAMPLTTLPSDQLFVFLKDYLTKQPVSIFVIGMPRGLDGKPSAMSQVVEKIGNKLKTTFPAQYIYYQDERFTSKLAAQGLYQAGYRKKDRQQKDNIDKVSATLMLQSFLNSFAYAADTPL